MELQDIATYYKPMQTLLYILVYLHEVRDEVCSSLTITRSDLHTSAYQIEIISAAVCSNKAINYTVEGERWESFHGYTILRNVEVVLQDYT